MNNSQSTPLAIYRVNYISGLPGRTKIVPKIQMHLAEDGFHFQKKSDFHLFIDYKQIQHFELVKGGGSWRGTAGVMDSFLEKLFEITFISASNEKIRIRFEMYHFNLHIKNQDACRELARLLKECGFLNHTQPSVLPTPTSDIPTQIAKLAELHQAGVLTTEEFEAKKAELLARM